MTGRRRRKNDSKYSTQPSPTHEVATKEAVRQDELISLFQDEDYVDENNLDKDDSLVNNDTDIVSNIELCVTTNIAYSVDEVVEKTKTLTKKLIHQKEIMTESFLLYQTTLLMF